MKRLTKYDWLLIISAPTIAVYLWAAMFTSILSGWPLGNGVEGWFGSFASIIVGSLCFLFWLILSFIRATKLLRKGYDELAPTDKAIVVRIARNATREFIRTAKRRRDRLGKAIRLAEKLTKET